MVSVQWMPKLFELQIGNDVDGWKTLGFLPSAGGIQVPAGHVLRISDSEVGLLTGPFLHPVKITNAYFHGGAA